MEPEYCDRCKNNRLKEYCDNIIQEIDKTLEELRELTKKYERD